MICGFGISWDPRTAQCGPYNSQDSIMKAAIQTGLRTIEIVDMDKPIALPGTVIVKVSNVGICGSDLGPYKNRPERQAFPSGHELSGVVVEAGSDVDNVTIGQRVTIDPVASATCGECEYCLRGQFLHCRAWKTGFGGGFAEYVRTKPSAVFALPDNVDDVLGAAVEPVAVGVHAVRKMQIRPGMVGAIIGAGSIGLSALAAALDAGSETVYVVAKHPAQAKLAMEIGAAGILPMDPAEARIVITNVTHGLGADFVIETVGGTADTLDFACMLARPLGMLGVLGAFDRGFRGFEILPALERELTIHLSNCYSSLDGVHDFSVAIDLLSRKGALLRKMVTHELPLDDIQAAFELAADKTSNSIKVQVRV
jgi:threonine dehydrogenase-like Zn-dependent dehydrogenase